MEAVVLAAEVKSRGGDAATACVACARKAPYSWFCDGVAQCSTHTGCATGMQDVFMHSLVRRAPKFALRCCALKETSVIITSRLPLTHAHCPDSNSVSARISPCLFRAANTVISSSGAAVVLLRRHSAAGLSAPWVTHGCECLRAVWSSLSRRAARPSGASSREAARRRRVGDCGALARAASHAPLKPWPAGTRT